MAAGAIGTATSGRRGRKRRTVMSEINVTPFVDVMLVLLIVFMISAPLLSRGVPVRLPQSQAKALGQSPELLVVSLDAQGKIYLQNEEVTPDQLKTKLKAITDTRGGTSAPLYFRGDREIKYDNVARLLGLLNSIGYSNIVPITE
jgi:biopolymer transport protein TolR